MKIKSFFISDIANRGVINRVLGQDSSIIIVPIDTDLSNLLNRFVNNWISKKGDSIEDKNEIVSYFINYSKNLLDNGQLSKFIEDVNMTMDSLYHTLIEGTVFRVDNQFVIDYIFAKGALLSAKLLNYCLPDSYLVDGKDLIVTDDAFGDALILWEESGIRIKSLLSYEGNIVVSGGYGKTKDGYATSLGRGGKDLTATIIGSVLNSETIEFYTTFNGIQGIKRLTYEEAAQLSFSDDGIIYPPAIWPAVKKNIPIIIYNINNPTFAGTYISSNIDLEEKTAIKGISVVNNVCLITVYGNGLLGKIGTASKLFGIMAEAGVNIMFISQSSSEYSISFAISEYDSASAIRLISGTISNKHFLSFNEAVIVNKDVSIMSVCGNKMKNVPGVSGKVFTILGDSGINIIASAQGGEELNISFVIDSNNVEKARNSINDYFKI